MLGSFRSIRSLCALALPACLLLAAACGDDGDPEQPDGASEPSGGDGEETSAEPFYGGHRSDVYSDDANWVCKPGLADDVCSRDLDATVVHADGTTEVQPHEPAQDPDVDCFYVYPTVNIGGGANADLEPGEETEIWAAYHQAARLTSVCRVFAPIYRQATIMGEPPEPGVNPWTDVAYEDVLDAFRHYIDNESDGRPFVLVGHSQGSDHLRRLIAEEIDGEPALLERMVSAFPLGWALNVPEGEVTGGTFQNVPVCEAPDQTGCVVGYSAYRSTNLPGEGDVPAAYGKPRDYESNAHAEGAAAEGMTVICANPAALEGGPAPLQPYFHVDPPEGAVVGNNGIPPFGDDEARLSEITTPYVTFPDLLEGECVSDGEHSYLKVTVTGGPGDVRGDDFAAEDLQLMGMDWGLHVSDPDIAMGDIVDLIAAQSQAAVQPK